MTQFEPGSDEWLNQVQEAIIDPARPIIDPHHHLWMKRFNRDYVLPQYWSDTESGHNIVKTLFMECRAFYLRDGPDYLRPVGETAYIADLARQTQARLTRESTTTKAIIAGIIAHADLTLAGESSDKLLELLEQHRVASLGLLRGIRHSAARDPHPKDLLIVSAAPPYLLGKESFRQGLRILAEQGLTYDSWHYHHQNEDFIELAQAVPECTMILDHFGTPLGVGVYRNCRDEIFRQWKLDMAALARCPNVYAKLGGLAMPDNGFGWDRAVRPPTSDELVQSQKRYYLHMLDCFGPERCMFESNFPVDRLSVNYHVLWNAFKKMTQELSEPDKHALFYGTAEKVYSL